MAFDYKKEYKEFYLPPKKPQIITVPAMNFVAVQTPMTRQGNTRQRWSFCTALHSPSR